MSPNGESAARGLKRKLIESVLGAGYDASFNAHAREVRQIFPLTRDMNNQVENIKQMLVICVFSRGGVDILTSIASAAVKLDNDCLIVAS